MIVYTKDHLWLSIPEKLELDYVYIGITKLGDEAMSGIQYIDVMDDKLIVESIKTSLELDIPADGKLELIAHEAVFRDNSSLSAPVARITGCTKIDYSKVQLEDNEE